MSSYRAPLFLTYFPVGRYVVVRSVHNNHDTAITWNECNLCKIALNFLSREKVFNFPREVLGTQERNRFQRNVLVGIVVASSSSSSL